jgi:hypothetical protein
MISRANDRLPDNPDRNRYNKNRAEIIHEGLITQVRSPEAGRISRYIKQSGTDYEYNQTDKIYPVSGDQAVLPESTVLGYDCPSFAIRARNEK